MAPLGRRGLRRFITIAVVVVAIVVVVLVGLVAGGVLVLPSNSPAPVTISSVHLVIQEGNTSSVPWFGPWSINYTANEGFPLEVPSGETWSVVWANFFNFDSVNHTIYSVTPSHPFTIAYTLPALPHIVAAASEGSNLGIYVAAPSTPGATYAVTLVVDTLRPG
jgi:hypothetical protein